MGQGTDSCGGYDVDYDPYHEELDTGIWTQRNGIRIHVSKMTPGHLRGAIKVASAAKHRANFTDDIDKWDAWLDILRDELDSRSRSTPATNTKQTKTPATNPSKSSHSHTTPAPTRGKKISLKCHCGATYQARQADYDRGWARSCSKSCAAIRREHKTPGAKKYVK